MNSFLDVVYLLAFYTPVIFSVPIRRDYTEVADKCFLDDKQKGAFLDYCAVPSWLCDVVDFHLERVCVGSNSRNVFQDLKPSTPKSICIKLHQNKEALQRLWQKRGESFAIASSVLLVEHLCQSECLDAAKQLCNLLEGAIIIDPSTSIKDLGEPIGVGGVKIPKLEPSGQGSEWQGPITQSQGLEAVKTLNEQPSSNLQLQGLEGFKTPNGQPSSNLQLQGLEDVKTLNEQPSSNLQPQGLEGVKTANEQPSSNLQPQGLEDVKPPNEQPSSNLQLQGDHPDAPQSVNPQQTWNVQNQGIDPNPNLSLSNVGEENEVEGNGRDVVVPEGMPVDSERPSNVNDQQGQSAGEVTPQKEVEASQVKPPKDKDINPVPANQLPHVETEEDGGQDATKSGSANKNPPTIKEDSPKVAGEDVKAGEDGQENENDDKAAIPRPLEGVEGGDNSPLDTNQPNEPQGGDNSPPDTNQPQGVDNSPIDTHQPNEPQGVDNSPPDTNQPQGVDNSPIDTNQPNEPQGVDKEQEERPKESPENVQEEGQGEVLANNDRPVSQANVEIPGQEQESKIAQEGDNADLPPPPDQDEQDKEQEQSLLAKYPPGEVPVPIASSSFKGTTKAYTTTEMYKKPNLQFQSDYDDDEDNGFPEKDKNQLENSIHAPSGGVQQEATGPRYKSPGFENNPPESHFLFYFFTVAVTCVLGYLVFHNKKKIIALVIEGRSNGNGRRRRPSTNGYKRLDDGSRAF